MEREDKSEGRPKPVSGPGQLNPKVFFWNIRYCPNSGNFPGNGLPHIEWVKP